MKHFIRDYIWSHSRKRISLENPKPDDFDIESIAIGLSRTGRFNGQSRIFYPVSEHSIRVSSYLKDELRLVGLLHDSSESLLNDISAPLKCLIGPKYYEIEEKFMQAIAKKFDFKWNKETKAQVKIYDEKVVMGEIRDIMLLPPDEVVDFSNACSYKITRKTDFVPAVSAADFLQEYYALIEDRIPY